MELNLHKNSCKINDTLAIHNNFIVITLVFACPKIENPGLWYMTRTGLFLAWGDYFNMIFPFITL
jgi:hypothetical protein